ncbi:MAG: hypothetical protein F6K18_09620 [Okeania sp. SIO2C2]|uniref:asparagine synthetase B family protein n=1 Tax=Okeania sp. SIO2C2 TaxID=2607787 RepID=UPI0013BD463E|nr:asparagine synthase-related protein [Okeania sp. SIO2C2]NEP87069.1 hypothetical protein [Okeania sp. SIO2C2]
MAKLWKKTFLLLEGIFALAVWDREEKELWIGRDRVGGRTLYYTTTDSTIWISPRLKILSSYHSNELDLIALRDYLCCAFVPGERTLWQEVKELRPGSFIRFTNDLKIPSPMSYWQPQAQVKNADRPLEYHGEKLRSLLDKIIPEYLPNNQPVGAYLSGGLDSSCIVALAAKNHDYPVHTYSIHFGAELPNELEFSSLVVQHCQTQHHILEITPDDMWNKLPITMANLDDPIGDPLTVPNYLLGNLAAENVGVILNGEGGDPCFGGPKNKPMLLNNIYGVLQSGKSDIVSSYLSSFHKCFADLSKLLKPEIWEAIKTEPYIFESDLNSDADLSASQTRVIRSNLYILQGATTPNLGNWQLEADSAQPNVIIGGRTYVPHRAIGPNPNGGANVPVALPDDCIKTAQIIAAQLRVNNISDSTANQIDSTYMGLEEPNRVAENCNLVSGQPLSNGMYVGNTYVGFDPTRIETDPGAFHAATVIAQDGGDNVTMEVVSPRCLNEDSPLQFDYLNVDFDMYNEEEERHSFVNSDVFETNRETQIYRDLIKRIKGGLIGDIIDNTGDKAIALQKTMGIKDPITHDEL